MKSCMGDCLSKSLCSSKVNEFPDILTASQILSQNKSVLCALWKLGVVGRCIYFLSVLIISGVTLVAFLGLFCARRETYMTEILSLRSE